MNNINNYNFENYLKPKDLRIHENNTSSRIPFNKPCLRGNELEYIQSAVDLGQLSGDGYYTQKCSELITELTGSKYCLLTHSCTAALEMAAILCNLGPGDEVIMPSFTFVSTANAVVLRGATPVFVDVKADTLNLDPNQVKRAISPNTKAVFVVHYAGYVADMPELLEICRENNLLLVEDAAQALGSKLNTSPAGSFGDLAALSFHETKNIFSGEGGALVLNNDTLYERAEIIREKGTNRKKFFRGQTDKYTWVDIGSSFLPGELISSFLYGQLQHHSKVLAERRYIFDIYHSCFKTLADEGRVGITEKQENRFGNGHLFYILTNSNLEREQFISFMKKNDIVCPFHYVPLHSSPAGLKYGKTVGEMNVTNNISSRLVRLPLFPALIENNEIDRVTSKVYEFYSIDL